MGDDVKTAGFRSILVAGFFWAGAVLGVSSCGGGGGGSCGAAQTCGGDVLGTWKVTSSCFAAAPGAFADADCPTLKVDVSGLTVSGTDVFKADKTEETNASYGGSMTLTYPGSCLSSTGAAPNCDLLTTNIAAELALPSNDTPFKSATCKPSGGGCACTFSPGANTTTTTDTYSTSGAVLTETNSKGEVTQSTYCVDGDKMIQHLDGMAMGSEGLSGTITLMRQ